MSAKQACDSCNRRKIRCNGLPPCDGCRRSDLECTFDVVPKKRGPRPKVIQAIRASQVQATSSTTQATPINTSGDLNLHAEDPASFVPSPALKSCVHVFFERMYPIMPILHRETVYNSLSRIHLLPEAYCLISSLCGIVIMQPRMDPEVYPAASHENYQWPSVEYLIQETIQCRNRSGYIKNPTLWTVITSFFLFACYFGLDEHNAAWFYLRESISFAQLIGLADEDSYATLGDETEATLRRRMFWLLFVTERAYAIQRHRPLALQKSISLPEVPDGEESVLLQGFLDLVNLFQHFDDSFVSLWNQSTTVLSDTSWISRLQENLSLALPDVDKRTEIQQADLLVSRQWLKLMVWQLCVRKGLLKSKGNDEGMSLYLPIQIARDMVIICRHLPASAIEPHGVGILEKVFDIGYSLANCMKVLPLWRSRFEIGPRDYLVEILRTLSTIRGGQSRYFPLLISYTDEVLNIHSGNPTADQFLIPTPGPGVVLGELEGDESGYGSQRGSVSSTAAIDTTPPLASFHCTQYSPTDIIFPYPGRVESRQRGFSTNGWTGLGIDTGAMLPSYEFETRGLGEQGQGENVDILSLFTDLDAVLLGESPTV